MRKFVALGSALLAVGITHTAMTGVMRDGRHPGGHVQPVAKMKVNTLAPDKFARQVTLVADTDHSDIEVLRTFKDVMANFVKDGGKHIVLEQGSVYQEIFDAVKRGVVSLDDFKDVLSVSGYIPPEQVAEAQDLMADIFNLCLQAKDCNIHALDSAPQVATENPEMWAMITKMNMTGEAGAKQFKALMGDPRFKKEYEEFTARFQQERREKDEEVTSRIKGLTDNGDKVLVFYGADHIKRLAEELGFANVQGIYIVNSERSNPYEDLPELDRS